MSVCLFSSSFQQATFVVVQWSVLLPVVLTLIANYNENKFVSRIADLCYTKWALEAFVIANAKRFEITIFTEIIVHHHS